MEPRQIEMRATTPDPTWTVQCAGYVENGVKVWCGLVTVGPLAGRRLPPPFLPYASSGLCPECYVAMMAKVRARRDASKAS